MTTERNEKADPAFENPDTGAGQILLVDDEPAARCLLQLCLAGDGHRVAVARDGREGLTAARAAMPDVLLTDWTMPGLDGPDLIRELRADRNLRGIYIILITGRDSGDDRVAGLDAGADEYLVKPWGREELRARVRTGLRIQRLRRELVDAERRAALLTMAATLGHAVNNPLTVLSAALQLARIQPPAGDALTQLLDRCEAQVERIAQVVAALRNLGEPRLTSYLGADMLELAEP